MIPAPSIASGTPITPLGIQHAIALGYVCSSTNTESPFSSSRAHNFDHPSVDPELSRMVGFEYAGESVRDAKLETKERRGLRPVQGPGWLEKN